MLSPQAAAKNRPQFLVPFNNRNEFSFYSAIFLVLVTQHRRKFQDAALFDPNGRSCMRSPSLLGVTPKKFTRAQSTAIVELIALKLASDVRQTLFVDSTASLRANLADRWASLPGMQAPTQ